MTRTYEKDDRPVISTKSTSPNFQARPFAPPQSAVSQVNQTAEGQSIQAKRLLPENLLGKGLFTPRHESSGRPVQRDVLFSRRTPVQAKLNIGEPDDKYEKEADIIAAKVVQQINSSPQENSVPPQEGKEDSLQRSPKISKLQRQSSVEEEDEDLQRSPLMQRREKIGGGEASEDLESSIQSARGGGQSLDSNLQVKMGQAMGADFSRVKVHTDARSDQLNRSIQAKAFTTGQDVFFRQGAYQPSSRGGQELIAHELTHVVQQNGGAVQRKHGNLQQKSLPQSNHQIHRSASGQIQRLWNKKKFKEETKDGILDRRGKTIKSIEKLIDEYGKFNPYSQKDLKSAQDLLLELREHVDNWVKDHTGDKSRADRMIGMKAFLVHLDSDEIPKLKKIEANITNKSNTTGGTLKLEDSSRGDKLKTIKANHEGSAKSGLEILAPLLDSSVVNAGDKSKFELDLKIPCDPSGIGFVGIHLVCQSERKKSTELNARCELTATGGGKFAGMAEVKGELGGYFEAQAPTSKQVMQLISYAFYRRLVQSKGIPVEVSNFMWGGTTSTKGYNKAERWAGNVEKEIFGEKDSEKAYVETGALAAASVSGGIKDVGGVGMSGKVGVKGSYGTRFTKDSVEHHKKNVGGLGAVYQNIGQRGAQKNIGKTVFQLEIPIEGTVGMFKLAGKGKLVVLEQLNEDKDYTDPKDKSTKKSLKQRITQRIDEGSLEVSAQATIPVHQGVLGGLPQLISGYVNSIGQSLLLSKDKNSSSLGLLQSLSTDAGMAAAQMAMTSGKQFTAFKPSTSLGEQYDKFGAFGASSGSIGAKIGYKGKIKPNEAATDQKDESGVATGKKIDNRFSHEISVNYVKTGTFLMLDTLMQVQNNAIDLLTIKQENESRLFTLKYEKGKWVINPETALELVLKDKNIKKNKPQEKSKSS